MLGNRFRKGFLFTKKLKWKKGHAKVRLVKKKNIFINKNNLLISNKNLLLSKEKIRTKIYKRIYKKKLIKFKRRQYLILKNFEYLKYFYKKYSYPILISQTYGKIADFHLENMRRILRKNLGKHVVIFIRIKPFLIVLKRSNLVRMGGGKGSKLNKVVYPVYPGCPLIEVRGAPYEQTIKAFKNLYCKLPIKTKLFFSNYI